MSGTLDLATKAAQAAGLDAALTEKVSTIFVPTAEAITSYALTDPGAAARLVTAGGQAAITAHVIPNTKLRSSDFPDGSSSYNTVAGTSLSVSNRGGQVTVSSGTSSANVVSADIETGNAVIHFIDNVLAPVM